MFYGSISSESPKYQYESNRAEFQPDGYPRIWKIITKSGDQDQPETWTMRFKQIDTSGKFNRDEIFGFPSLADYTVDDITSGVGVQLLSIGDVKNAEAGKLPSENTNRLPILFGYLEILSLAAGGIYRFWKR